MVDLPPSAKLVRRCLGSDPLDQEEIHERSGLLYRTIHDALNELEETGIVESRPSVTDARKHVYWLTDPDVEFD